MPIPRTRLPDSTLALLREGYEFISNRCDRYGTDAFETRLMLRRAVCMRGAEAAAAFYEPGRFTRRGALPPIALTLLQHEGSVAQLDDGRHLHRKEMFMGLMTPPDLERLHEVAAAQWRHYVREWQTMAAVRLQAEVEEILCRTACAWTGVPLPDEEVELRARDLAALIDGAGSIGMRQARAQHARRRTERWMRDCVAGIRNGALVLPEDHAAARIALHRERDGEPLPLEVAGTELLNVVRPLVAVTRYITFCALALHEHREWRRRLRDATAAEREQFAHEVRRFYPFIPFVAGHARRAFEWRGERIPEDGWVLLDVYGTNRDPRSWDQPAEFRPERFAGWDADAFTLISQGGGSFADHRCAGEWATLRLMRVALHVLTAWIDYDVPEQDLRIILSRVPAVPKSGFVIKDVRVIV